MNRIDELTDRLIDGTLTDAEAIELESLLAADPTARKRHLAQLRLELVLRGLRTEFDIAEPTVARIESDRVERTTAVVMSELAKQPVPVWDRRSARRLRLWSVFTTLTAVLLIAIWLGTRSPQPVLAPNTEGPAITRLPPEPALPIAPEPHVLDKTDLARLVTLSGVVEIVDPTTVLLAQPDQLLKREQTLHTVGEDSTAVLEFPDRTRIELHPDTVVRLGGGEAGAVRKIVLSQGRVTTTATGRRIVVGTEAAEVETSRGSFSLWSAGLGSARVESMNGDVRVVRGVTADPMLLGPGRAAFIRDEQSPVRIESLRKVQETPRERLNFMALDVQFADDGEVWATSAKQWTRWKPGTPEQGRVVYLPKVFNDGVASWLTPDQRAVAICRTDDKEDRISIRLLPSGEERGVIPARVSEPRFLCIGPDASWVVTAGGQKPNNRRVRVWDVATGKERFAHELDNSVTCLAASPNGHWLAVGVSDLGKGTDNAVVVFDPTTGKQLFKLATKRKSIMSIAFAADGQHLAAGFNGAIQIWNVPNRKLLHTLEGFERVVTRLAYSPQEKMLAAGTQDGQVWVWSAETWQRRQVLETGTRGVRSLAFSADGKLLVTATNKAGVAVWDLAPEPANPSGLDNVIRH